MTPINVDLNHIPTLSSSPQSSLAFPLSQPIKIRGQLNEQAIITDIDSFYKSGTVEMLSSETAFSKIINLDANNVLPNNPEVNSIGIKSQKPKSLNPKSLNPKSLNPKSLNPKSLNPKSLEPKKLVTKSTNKDEDKPQLIEDTTQNLEDSNWQYSINIGVDEVGRGPLYGSVVVSAVILPHLWSGELLVDTFKDRLRDTPLSILTDSKKLTELKREKLFNPIIQSSLAHVTIEVPSVVIDQINILQATMLGMRLACERLLVGTAEKIKDHYNKTLGSDEYNDTVDRSIDYKVLIDGNKVPELDLALLNSHDIGKDKAFKLSSEAWVKGDARHTAIAAASVLAKVTRDRQVIQDSKRYPGYGLEGHKGYPTKLHLEAINRLGVLPQHRRSYRPIQEAILNGTPELKE